MRGQRRKSAAHRCSCSSSTSPLCRSLQQRRFRRPAPFDLDRCTIHVVPRFQSATSFSSLPLGRYTVQAEFPSIDPPTRVPRMQNRRPLELGGGSSREKWSLIPICHDPQLMGCEEESGGRSRGRREGKGVLSLASPAP